MHRVEAFCFALGQVLQAHRFDGEACLFDAREDLSGKLPFDRVGLNDCERLLH
jgi:hypothetical protein